VFDDADRQRGEHMLRGPFTRRYFVSCLGGAAVAWPLATRAQHTSSHPLIGVLSPLSSASAAHIEAFRAGLRELGYLEGRDITIEPRFAEGVIERLPELVTELVALKPAVIVAGSPPAALADRNVTRAIPIVINSSENPVVLGLAASLARPGGNVTGFWWDDEGLTGKRFELLKEAMPGTTRVGISPTPAVAQGVYIGPGGVGVDVGRPGWRERHDRAYRDYAYERDDRRSGCRTVTIERDDGSMKRIRRCD
jgi:ABC-type uncharacterized transport system substrate-binding protein